MIQLIAIALLLSMAECTFHDKDVHAFETTEGRTYSSKERIDFGIRDDIKAQICKRIDCPTHISVDEVKVSGNQIDSAHVTIHYNF